MCRMHGALGPLTRRFYRRDPESLARALLGRLLVRRCGKEDLVGRIVEVEAYLGEPDRAAHSYGGRHTDRNHAMYLDGGHAYVYFTYGMHHCLNVVSDRVGVPTACLIRAIEPLEGLDVMRVHRSTKIAADRLRDTDLGSGPAKVAQALGVDLQQNGWDLVGNDQLFVAGTRSTPDRRIVTAPRVGVGYAGAWAGRRLRFCVAGNRHVSVRPPDR